MICQELIYSDKLICSVDAKYIVFNIMKFKFERKGGHGFQVYSVHDINVKKTFLIFQKSIYFLNFQVMLDIESKVFKTYYWIRGL